MRSAILFAAAAIGLGFPTGLGLAVYLASGSSLAPPAASARVPTGTIAEPSTLTTGQDVSGNCDEPEHRLDPECLPGATVDETTTGETTTDETETTETGDDSSGKGRGRGRGRGRGGDD
jgi:hypothetical protein